jgi:hypothetical protein
MVVHSSVTVGDPDPHVFGPPGSGSISQRYGTDPTPDPSLCKIGFLHKIVKAENGMSLSREASPVPHEVGHVVHGVNRSYRMVELQVEIYWCFQGVNQ